MGIRGLDAPIDPRFAPPRTGSLQIRPRAVPALGRAATFGVLLDWLEPYQSAVVGGMLEAGREYDANIVCFVGGTLHARFRSAERRNVVFDLALSKGIDGLLIVSDPLGTFLGVEDLARFCDRYRPLPMSSIAARIGGMTSILIDGEQALREGIRHMVEDHEYRRIAFISGTEGNLDARLRLRIYDEVLTAYGLRPPDSLVATGDFTYESGVEAVRVLLDERGATFDAIVVANDQMALGAVDALRARDIQVPRDVAVIGFDDTPEARYCAPPLTTIRQPLHQQGKLAVQVLLQRLRGEQVDDVIVLPAELVIRRSCGCFSDARRVSKANNLPAPLTSPGTGLTVEDALRLNRSRMLEAMREPMIGPPGAIPEGWEESLLDALIAELRGAPRHGFAKRINALLEDVVHTSATGGAWQPVLSSLWRELMPCLASHPVMRMKADDLLQEARVMVVDAVEHTQAQHRLTIDRRSWALSEAAEKLSAAFDLESLGTALRECLPTLGIPSAYLVLDAEISSSGARVAFAHDLRRDPAVIEGLRDAPVQGTRMPEGLLPIDRTCAMVVASLFFKDDPFGYAIFEMGPMEGLTYEALRGEISSALKVALLIEELQVRADELQGAYGALQDNQQRLLSSEKMASLGRITANIAHEMNTPLAAVRTALVEIDLRAVEYQASVGDAEVSEEDHLQIAAEMRAAIQLARSAAERAAGFVRGIKTQTRDLAPQERMRFDPVQVIEEALLLLSYDLRRASGGVRFVPPERPIELLGTPGRLAQIVTNLVTNALDALPAEGDGTVSLLLTADDVVARLEVSDNGIGIPTELQEKVFEPMFTTKPLGEGTGLGLSIVRDLVDGHFGGRIDLASEPGHGSTFTLTFPLAGKD